MVETATSARRWNSFVCPACRFVFRVAQDHDGKGVVCPACRGMLRLPTEDCPPGPLVMAPVEEVLPEEDEAEEVEEQSGDHPLRLLLAVSVPALLLLGIFAWWMMPKAADRERATALAQEQAKAAEKEQEEKKPAVAPENLALTVDKVTKGFLEARTPDDLLKWIRLPEQVGPKIRAWYAGQNYKAPGFRTMMGEFHYSVKNGRELVVVPVRTGNYEMRELMLVHEKQGWLADWESWAPWSELSWPELRQKRPTEPKLFRAVISEVKYYNFGFKERDWRSYKLDSLDGEQSIYGYASLTSPVNARIDSFVEKDSRKAMIVRIQYPPAAPIDNQVEIVELVSENWVDLSGPPPP